MPHVYACYKLSLIHLFARCESFRNTPRAQSQCTDIVVNGRVYFIINTSRTRVSIFVSMIYYRADSFALHITTCSRMIILSIARAYNVLYIMRVL